MRERGSESKCPASLGLADKLKQVGRLSEEPAIKMPTYYDCQRCTACCRWPGQVRVAPDELARLAAFQSLSERDFIQNRLKTEIFNQALGVEKGDQVEAQRDPQILKALEVISNANRRK